MSIIYLIIYNRYINFFLRWINKGLSVIFPVHFKIPPSGVIQLNNGKNRFKLATNQTSYLTQQLFWHGISSFEYSTIFRSLIKKVDCFIDVGANIGYYTILACTENRNIKVYSFEPAKGAGKYLQKNVLLNDFDRQVSIEEIALTDNRETLTFHEVENDKYRFTRDILSGESNAATKNLNREFKTYNVPGITLDEYCEGKSVTCVDLIKIDTEGSEFRILKGGYEIISSHLPIIICEILFDFNEEKIESIMTQLGYESYIFKNDNLIKVDSIVRAIDDGVRDCFFVHPSKSSLIEEFIRKEE